MAKVTKGRVTIPRNVEENLQLASKVYEKHLKDGASSVLNNLSDVSWETTGDKIALCLEKHLEAEELKRKMEECYRTRDMFFPEITEVLQASRGLLKGIYSKNPKKLGDWGFDVDDSPKPKKP
jgi:hypothetical protein